MAVVVSCPHCKTKIQVRPEHSGRQVACPQCKGAFTIPAMAGATRSTEPRVAAPATPPAKSKPAAVAPVRAQPASTDEPWSESVSSGPSTDDPLGFLNGSESKHVKPALAAGGTRGKPKSFMDTMAAAVGNLFGSQSASKNAKIGTKLKGLPPPTKNALLGCGALLASLVLCAGVATMSNHGTTLRNPKSVQEAKEMVVGVWTCTAYTTDCKFIEVIAFKSDGTYEWDDHCYLKILRSEYVGKLGTTEWPTRTFGNWRIARSNGSFRVEPKCQSGNDPELSGPLLIDNGTLVLTRNGGERRFTKE